SIAGLAQFVRTCLRFHLDLHSLDVGSRLMSDDSGDTTQQRPEPIHDPIFSETPLYRGNDREPDAVGREPTAWDTAGTWASHGRRFRVLHPHGRGGLGEVFVAIDSELDRPVALKQIQDHRADDPSSRARFLREARITGALEHPGIVPVYALGTDPGGRPYYAM